MYVYPFWQNPLKQTYPGKKMNNLCIIKFGSSRLEKLKFSVLFALQNIRLRNKVSIFSIWQIKLYFLVLDIFLALKN